MADTEEERSLRAEQQRTRRLTKRSCGYCGEPAGAMVGWGKRQAAICEECLAKLQGPAVPVPVCAFDEVHPQDLRPQTSLEAVVVEARLLPARETVVEELKPSLAGRIRESLGRLFRRKHDRGTIRAIPGELD